MQAREYLKTLWEFLYMPAPIRWLTVSQYGNEFPIGKVLLMGQHLKEKTDVNYGFLIENNDFDIHFP